MAAFDPPWRLDPLKRIVSVGWGARLRYFTIFERIIYNFGTPSTMAINNLPPGVNHVYPFTAPLYQRRKPTLSPSTDPITSLTVAGLYSWGKGDVIISEGTFATAEVGFSLLNKDLSVQVIMPGTQAARTGDPITLYDLLETSIYHFHDGSTGGGNALLERVTQSEFDYLLAHTTGSNDSASWEISYEIIRTYVEEGQPIPHRITRILLLAAKRFKKDDHGAFTTEDMDIEGPKSYFDAGTSSSPLGTKTATIDYTAKTAHIKVTIL
jgi:hypothetical protein